MTKKQFLMLTSILFVSGLAAGGLSNASGAKLQYRTTEHPSGVAESTNAVGAKLTVGSNPSSPIPQENATGAKLLPADPTFDTRTDQQEQLIDRWVVR